MLKAKDCREKAREALKGKWVQASIAGFIAGAAFYRELKANKGVGNET